jgi:SAM-dependent methyltransferase
MDWHRRYLQQAAWTRPLRDYLLEKAGISRAQCVLEVGCGTGVILRDAAQESRGRGLRTATLHGLDLKAEPLLQARLHLPSAILCCGDALALPYADRSFDISFSHFLLLWVRDPARALQEMKRVTRPRGHVLAFAEPDYGARLDHPPDLVSLGRLQEGALKQQGANTAIGSQLAGLFQECEMQVVETGTIAPWRPQAFTNDEFAGEWDVLREDLNGLVPEIELDRMMLLDEQARRRGDRILQVPTYFVCAQV